MSFILSVLVLWVLTAALLYAWKRDLLKSTWNEPFVAHTPVLIESDDWGPGPELHGERMDSLSEVLAHHTDSDGRPAVLTADMVLAVPDTKALRENGYTAYARRFLDDGFTQILDSLRRALARGTLVPQLHGLEHTHGTALLSLAAAGDEGVRAFLKGDDGTGWESLASHLQGHYVDGSKLPTEPVPEAEQREHVRLALEAFERIFGFASLSTVAPCYLWQDITEKVWADQGIRYVQTAGYRCVGRDSGGRYLQDPAIIRPGHRNNRNQIYMVRNAMYEPADGRGVDTCLDEARTAIRQALPVVISTHRYNYTGTESDFLGALNGLNRILTTLTDSCPRIKFLSSPELGAWMAGDPEPLTDPGGKVWPSLKPLGGLSRVRAFLFRLWYRHAKLRWLAIGTGLIVPCSLLVAVDLTKRKG